MKFSHSTSDINQLSQPYSKKTDLFSWINPLNKTYRGYSMASGHYSNHFLSARYFVWYDLETVKVVTLICLMLLVCLLLRAIIRRTWAATTTHLLIFWNKKAQASCWLANCQRAMAGIGFTLKPQRISGHIQTTKGQPGVVPYKKTTFWFWTLPSALESSPGILFLFDSVQKKKKKPQTPPMEGRREKNTSQ